MSVFLLQDITYYQIAIKYNLVRVCRLITPNKVSQLFIYFINQRLAVHSVYLIRSCQFSWSNLD